MKNFASNVLAGIVSAAIFAGIVYLWPSVSELVNFAADWQVAVLALLLLALGLCLGWIVRSIVGWSYAKRPETTKRVNQNEDDRLAIKGVSIEVKRMLKAAIVKGEIYCWNDAWSLLWDGKRKFYQQFLEVETVEGNRIKLTPNHQFADFYKANTDVFDVVDDNSFIQRAIYDPKRKASRYGFSNDELYWWWYTDDPDIGRGQEAGRGC